MGPTSLSLPCPSNVSEVPVQWNNRIHVAARVVLWSSPISGTKHLGSKEDHDKMTSTMASHPLPTCALSLPQTQTQNGALGTCLRAELACLSLCPANRSRNFRHCRRTIHADLLLTAGRCWQAGTKHDLGAFLGFPGSSRFSPLNWLRVDISGDVAGLATPSISGHRCGSLPRALPRGMSLERTIVVSL